MKRLLFACSAFLLLQSNAIAQCSCTSNSPINQGLVACYPFNGNANDQTSNANHGTPIDITATTDRFGNTNSAYYFNGNTSIITVPDNPILKPLNRITISVWVKAEPKPPTPPSWNFIVVCRKSNTGAPYNSYKLATFPTAPNANKWTFYLSSSANNIDNEFIGKRAKIDYVWEHIVTTYDGVKMNIYVNGDLDTSRSINIPNFTYSNLGVNIGNHNAGPSTGYKGAMDDLRIYNRALSACEVKYLYKNCTGEPTSSLITDTLIETCIGKQVQLDANNAGMSYSWTPTHLVNNPTIKNPLANTNQSTYFFVNATDGLCYYKDSIHVKINQPTIQLTKQHNICIGDSVQLQALGASSYAWLPNISLSDTSISNPFAKPNNTTTYYLLANVNGCQVIDSVRINVQSTLITSAGTDTTICFGDTIKLNANGGSIFNWSPFTTINDTISSSPLVWPRSNQYYYLYATSGTCFDYDTILVSVSPLPTLSINDTVICGTSQSFTPSLATANADTYIWQPNTYLSNSNIQIPLISPQQSITYFIEAYNSITGCKATDIFKISVNSPKAQFSASDSAVLIPNNVLLSNTSFPLPLNFDWLLNDTFKSNSKNLDLIIDKVGLNKIKLIVKDTNGCVDSIEQLVNGKLPKSIFIPNVFTPNGDGVNDLFAIDTDLSLFKEITGSIWNRWGGKLYEFNGKTGNWWNGEYQNKSSPEGVYFYMIKTITIQGTIKEYRGTLTLIQ